MECVATVDDVVSGARGMRGAFLLRGPEVQEVGHLPVNIFQYIHLANTGLNPC
jgi:hypothetical protein